MRKLIPAVVAAAFLTGAVPAVASDAPDLPPTDPLIVEGGANCGGEACTFQPYSVEVDKTYPSRLIAWAKGA